MIEQWGRRYGPVFTFAVGRPPGSSLHRAGRDQRDPARASRRLSAAGARSRRSSTSSGVSGVFAAEGDDWRRQRRLAVTALNTNHLRRYFDVIRIATARLLTRLERGARPQIQDDFMAYTVDVTSALAFGHDLNTLERDDDELQRDIAPVFAMLARRTLAPFPYWRVVKPPADRAAERSLGGFATRSPGSSPTRGPGSRPGPSCATRPRTSSRACCRRRHYSDDDVIATSSRCCSRARTRPPTRCPGRRSCSPATAPPSAARGRGRRRARRRSHAAARRGRRRHALRRGRDARGGAAEVDRAAAVRRAALRHDRRRRRPARRTRWSTLTRQAGRPGRSPASTPTAGSTATRDPVVAPVRRPAALLPGPQPRVPRGQGRAGDARAQLRRASSPGRRRASRSASRWARRTCDLRLRPRDGSPRSGIRSVIEF